MTTLVQVPGAVTSPSRRSAGEHVTRAVDVLVLAALALFAAWTVCYLLALAGALSSSAAFWLWVGSSPAVLAGVLLGLRRAVAVIPSSAPWWTLLIGVALSILSLVVLRPALDDASYVVRSTWIAAHGDVRVGDVIFSGGRWPGMAFQTPYLQSIEALFGWLARVSGLSVGTVVYVLFPPVGTFLATWALAMLFRAWGAARVPLCLALSAVFLLMGGAQNASWGNLFLARMWEGKIVFLAVAVPLLFALTAAFWRAEDAGGRRWSLVAVALVAVAGVGLTTAAVFVVPGIVLVSLLPGLVQRRWWDAARLCVVGACPGLAAGLVVLAGGKAADGIAPQAETSPWGMVLGSGVPALVVGVAAFVALLGIVLPRSCAACDPVGRWTVLAAVAAGVAVAVPALFDVAVKVMGTNAVAWRLTWIVPVPALVGLLAAAPRSRLRVGFALAAASGAALVWGGLPLWSPANDARLAAPPNWKMYPEDVAAARWVAALRPAGPVLAPATTSAALGVVTADVRPVGTRQDYMVMYVGIPGTRMDQRLTLQHLADGGADPTDLAAAPAALAALHVTVACGHPADALVQGVLVPAGYREAFSSGPLNCYVDR